MVDIVREMTSKKSCKFGEYGSFEHLLFLFHQERMRGGGRGGGGGHYGMM